MDAQYRSLEHIRYIIYMYLPRVAIMYDDSNCWLWWLDRLQPFAPHANKAASDTVPLDSWKPDS